MPVINAVNVTKTVADPNAEFESLKPIWNMCRAVCSGEKYVKSYDSYIDTIGFTNLLLPFSPTMTQAQYNFYKSEAEFPGITAQFAKMIVGGLLRKQPILNLPANAPEDAYDWIISNFGQDDSSLTAFLDKALWEEIQTSRAWVYIDYPKILNVELLTKDDLKDVAPYPILWDADTVINWQTKQNNIGKTILSRVVTRGFSKEYTEDNEFHPTFKETVWVHEINSEGNYQIRVFKKQNVESSIPVINGSVYKTQQSTREKYVLKDTITNILYNGEPLKFLPIWPLNGSIEPNEPTLLPIITKEISLYNKLSRRNHLLYGASTYTPIITSDMPDDNFEEIVASGLGSWIRLRQGDTASVLETPTAALQDMERAIIGAIEEMAKMGIRMLTPETAQSGIALEIRNAAQTAQLGTLNNKISNTMEQIICFMLNWRYGTEYKVADIEFSLSSDFNPVPLGEDWMRMSTEWYQQGLIPRSVWLNILKVNDLIPPDYNDDEGQAEINQDELVNFQKQQNYAYASQVNQAQLAEELSATTNEEVLQ